MPGGARGVKRCVTDRSQHNVKKRYEGGRGGRNLTKKRYVIVEQPLSYTQLALRIILALYCTIIAGSNYS